MPIFFLLAALVLLGGFAGAKLVTGLSPKIIRDTDKLEPKFRARFLAFAVAARGMGKPLIVAETWRPPERQAWLYGSGRAGDPKAVFNGVDYGRAGPWLTDRRPGVNPSNHERTDENGAPAAEAADTIPGLKWTGDDEFRAHMMALVPLAKTFGLKNLGAKDAGHWENA